MKCSILPTYDAHKLHILFLCTIFLVLGEMISVLVRANLVIKSSNILNKLIYFLCTLFPDFKKFCNVWRTVVIAGMSFRCNMDQ
jgi:hypothetical protein